MGQSPNEGTATWNVLSEFLESFIAAWERGSPPPLRDFVPAHPAAVRRLTLVELIKVDLELRRQHRAEPWLLEQYLADFPELCDEAGPPSDLVYEEFQIRRAADEQLDPDEYFARFPGRADELRRLFHFSTDAGHQSTLQRQRFIVEVNPGERIDDFDLLVQLGKGAFATVFLARQRSMQRLVALKVSADKGSEPQMLAQLDHPNIVRVFDQRRLPERGLRLMYMQYAPGGTLQNVIQRLGSCPLNERTGRILLEAVDAELERGGHMVSHDSASRRQLVDAPWPEVVCRVGAQLAHAFHYAHARNVLHRDVKPANVLLAGDGTPKLADFNISYSSDLAGETPAAYFGGSLAYMSPEQLEAFSPAHARRPDELDGRTDLYSLGVLLWELLFGTRPFQDDSAQGNWSKMLADMLERRQRGVSETEFDGDHNDDEVLSSLRQVLLKCLAPNADERYQTGEQLARELLLCLRPRTRRLLYAPRSAGRDLVLRFPVISLAIAALIPNAMAGYFNYAYNDQAIIQNLHGSESAFRIVMLIVNLVAYPVGVFLLGYLTWPVGVRVRQLAATPPASPEPTPSSLRRRALSLGDYAAMIGVVEWLIAGIAYPLILQVFAVGLSSGTYLHFVVSQTICGLIAAAYPYLLMTFLVLRCMYPAMLRGAVCDAQDERALRAVAIRSGIYMFVAGGVPALGTMLLLVAGIFTEAQNTFALLVLSVAGALGFGLAFGLYRLLVNDVEALRVVVAPEEMMGTWSDRGGSS